MNKRSHSFDMEANCANKARKGFFLCRRFSVFDLTGNQDACLQTAHAEIRHQQRCEFTILFQQQIMSRSGADGMRCGCVLSHKGSLCAVLWHPSAQILPIRSEVYTNIEQCEGQCHCTEYLWLKLDLQRDVSQIINAVRLQNGLCSKITTPARAQ